MRNRYRQSVRNLFNLYMPLADVWNVYLNVHPGLPELIARFKHCGGKVANTTIWEVMQKVGRS